MLSMGQMLQALRQLELKVGTTLYQIRKQREGDNDAHSQLDRALYCLADVQKELEQLTIN